MRRICQKMFKKGDKDAAKQSLAQSEEFCKIKLLKEFEKADKQLKKRNTFRGNLIEENDSNMFSISDLISLEGKVIEEAIFILQNHHNKSLVSQNKENLLYVKIKRTNYIKNSSF